MKLYFIAFILLTGLFFSCSDHDQDSTVTAAGKIKSKTLPKKKPSSQFTDTLKIISIAAVFYSPDSIQLQKMRSVTDSGAFEAIMHEYDYLSKTAHSILNKHFPQVQIIEAKNVKYLLFITTNKTEVCINLDKNYDPYGLYVFKRQQAPQLVDMANTETNLGFYFSK
jgi:hypothetical protein